MRHASRRAIHVLRCKQPHRDEGYAPCTDTPHEQYEQGSRACRRAVSTGHLSELREGHTRGLQPQRWRRLLPVRRLRSSMDVSAGAIRGRPAAGAARIRQRASPRTRDRRHRRLEARLEASRSEADIMADFDTTPYWQTTVALPRFRSLDRDLHVDVAIVGGGITGITAAYLLKKAGKSVALARTASLPAGRHGTHDRASHVRHRQTPVRAREIVRRRSRARDLGCGSGGDCAD